MAFLYCRNCGAKIPVRYVGYRLAGIGLCIFAVFGWFSYLFAGSGHAFLIACGIFVIGFVLAKGAEDIAYDMMKDKECPKCKKIALTKEAPETVQEPAAKISEVPEDRAAWLLARIDKFYDELKEAESGNTGSPATFEERLFNAIKKRDAGTVNSLVGGKDFSQSQETGKKALSLAIKIARRNPDENGESIYQIITSLFDHGAKIHVSDIEFKECLEPENRDFKLAAILAKTCVNMNGRNMLHAELSTECRPEIIRFMVEHGADVNWSYNGYGAKPIQTAMSNDISWVKMDTLFSVMAYLVKKGADINPIAILLQDLYDFQKFDHIRFALAYGIDVKYVSALIEENVHAGWGSFDIDAELSAYKREKEKNLRLTYMFENWQRLNGLPFWHFFWYVPKRYTGLTDETLGIRKVIYDFKDGIDFEKIKHLLKTKLLCTFGPRLSGMTFLCIPASSKSKSDVRYRKFSRKLCAELGMKDGYPHVSFIKEKTAAHLGGTDRAEFAFDERFFTFNDVILFDDVVTRGRSMREFKKELEEMACSVVCQISIGRTYNDGYVREEPIHPQTGEKAFIKEDDLSEVPF